MAILSAEAQAIIAAINGNVDSRVNFLNTKLDTVSDKVDNLSGNVKDLEITTKAHGDRLKNLEEELERLKNVGSSAASMGSSESTRGSSNSSSMTISKSNRKTLIFGGFPPDTDGEEVEKFLKEKMTGTDTAHIHSKGRFTEFGVVEFTYPKGMWDWLRTHKGQKLKFGDKSLWHAVDRPYEERQQGKKVGTAIRLIREALRAKGLTPEDAERMVQGDYTKGIVLYKENPTGGPRVRCYETARGATEMCLAASCPTVNGIDFRAILDEANTP